MNQWGLNQQGIGNGTVDNRVFLYISGLAQTTVVSAIYAKRYMVSSMRAATSGVSNLTGVFHLRSTMTATVTAVTGMSKYYAKYLSSSMTARTTSVIGMIAHRFLEAAQIVGVQWDAVLWRGQSLASDTTTTVTTTSSINIDAGYADDDRVSRIPADNRISKVV